MSVSVSVFVSGGGGGGGVSSPLEIVACFAHFAFDFALVVGVEAAEISEESVLGTPGHLTLTGRTHAWW